MAVPSAIRGYPFTDLWHPWVLALLLLLGVAYGWVTGPMNRHRGWGPAVPPSRRASFYLALAVLYLAEGSPLHLLAERFLFSAHMVQHVLLTFVLPPLVITGVPEWLWRWLLRPRPVARLFRALTHPLPALALFNAVYALWHLPVLYQAALHVHGIHMLEHGLLVPTALLMWWPVLSPLPEFPRLSEPAQLLYLFLMSAAQIGVFGYVTFNNQVIYDFYARAHRVWEISPRTDQQLAGAVMKVGATAVILWFMALAFFRWAAREEERDRQGAAAGPPDQLPRG